MENSVEKMYLRFKDGKKEIGRFTLDPFKEYKFALKSTQDLKSSVLVPIEDGPISCIITNQAPEGIWLTSTDPSRPIFFTAPLPIKEEKKQWVDIVNNEFMLGPILIELKKIDSRYTKIESTIPGNKEKEVAMWDTNTVRYMGRKGDKYKELTKEAENLSLGYPLSFLEFPNIYTEISQNHAILRKDLNGNYQVCRLKTLPVYYRLLEQTVLLEDLSYFQWPGGPSVTVQKNC